MVRVLARTSSTSRELILKWELGSDTHSYQVGSIQNGVLEIHETCRTKVVIDGGVGRPLHEAHELTNVKGQLHGGSRLSI
jgi:hypothetical protein